MVGHTPFGGSVGYMARVLSTFNQCFEKDFKRFDGSIPEQVLYAARQVRFNLLSPFITQSEKEMYWHITRCLIHRWTIIPDGHLYPVSGGNPSGQISTSIDNCIVNALVHQMINFEVYGGKQDADFWFYGDDVIGGSNTELKPHDEDQFLSQIGMEVPPSDWVIQKTPLGLSFCGYRLAHNPVIGWHPQYKPERILAKLLNPATEPDTAEAMWGKLVCVTLLLWMSQYRDQLYQNFSNLCSDTGMILLPVQFFEDFYGKVGGGPKKETFEAQNGVKWEKFEEFCREFVQQFSSSSIRSKT